MQERSETLPNEKLTMSPIIIAAGLIFANPEFVALMVECLLRILIAVHGRRSGISPRRPRKKARPLSRRKSSRVTIRKSKGGGL